MAKCKSKICPDDQQLSRVRRASQDLSVDLWDQNIVNGKYVIAYELGPGLDRLVLNLMKLCIINDIYYKKYPFFVTGVRRI